MALWDLLAGSEVLVEIRRYAQLLHARWLSSLLLWVVPQVWTARFCPYMFYVEVRSAREGACPPSYLLLALPGR